VANLDNPAGRLYALLDEYQEVVTVTPTVEQAWGKVLETDNRAVVVDAMAEMAGLVAAVNAAVRRQGRSAYQNMCAHHIRAWASPFLSDLEAGSQHVDSSAMVALNAVSDFLSERASEGSVPDEEERQSLRDELLAVIEETRDTADAPAEVRQLIVERLHQIVWALDHLHIGGPGAVTAAVERLAGSLIISHPEVAKNPPDKRTWKVLNKVWSAFRAGPAVLVALEAWPDVAERVLELGP
jgi:hypothetical protein